jgi:hypothetical protein
MKEMKEDSKNLQDMNRINIDLADKLGTHIQKHGFAILFFLMLLGVGGSIIPEFISMFRESHREEKKIRDKIFETHAELLKRFESLDRIYSQIDLRLRDIEERSGKGNEVSKLEKNAVISARIEVLLSENPQPGVKKAWFARLHNGSSDFANRPFAFFSVSQEAIFDGLPTRDRNQRILVEFLGDAWQELLKGKSAIYDLNLGTRNSWAEKNMTFGGTQKTLIYPVFGGKSQKTIVGLVAYEIGETGDIWLLKVPLAKVSLNISGLMDL